VFRAQIAVALLCVLIACGVLPIHFFDTQESNYPYALPGYQGVPQTPTTPASVEGAVWSHNGTENSLATMQTSRQRGYNGLPTV
jgi:hypothetical protein